MVNRGPPPPVSPTLCSRLAGLWQASCTSWQQRRTALQYLQPRLRTWGPLASGGQPRAHQCKLLQPGSLPNYRRVTLAAAAGLQLPRPHATDAPAALPACVAAAPQAQLLLPLLARTWQLGGGLLRLHHSWRHCCVCAFCLLMRALTVLRSGRKLQVLCATGCRAVRCCYCCCWPAAGGGAVRARRSVPQGKGAGLGPPCRWGLRHVGRTGWGPGQARRRGGGVSSARAPPLSHAKHRPQRRAPPARYARGSLLRAAARSLRPRHTRERPRPAAAPHVPDRGRH
jgi:hypothetical protein